MGNGAWQTYQVQAEAGMGNNALINHVVNDGGILLGCSDIIAEAKAHDTGGAHGSEGEAKLLVGDFMALNCDGVVEVVAGNVSLVEIGDVEAAFTD